MKNNTIDCFTFYKSPVPLISMIFFFLIITTFLIIVIDYLNIEIYTFDLLLETIASSQFFFLSLFLYLWFRTKYILKKNKIIHRHGLFIVRSHEVALPAVESIELSQDFMGRIFNYSNIKIYANGRVITSLHSVQNAHQAVFLIENHQKIFL